LAFCEKHFYHYLIRGGSLSNSGKKRIKHEIKNLVAISDIAEKVDGVKQENIDINKCFILLQAVRYEYDKKLYCQLFPQFQKNILSSKADFSSKIKVLLAYFSYDFARILWWLKNKIR
jgi:hypothetical protein